MIDPVRHRRLVAGLRRKYCAGTGVAIVEISGLIEDVSADAIDRIQAAGRRGAKTLAILIDSCGGFLDQTFDVVAAIGRFNGRTVGVVVGDCDSAAAVLLASCETRVAAVDSQFTIHSTWVDSSGRREMNLATIEATRSQLKRHDRKVRAFMADRCGKEFARLYDGRDHTLTAREAERLGLLKCEWEASLSARRPSYDPAMLDDRRRAQAALRAGVMAACAAEVRTLGVHGFLHERSGR